nr:FAD-dependent oxidoreductase [Actinokineospora inagensis]
MAGLAAAVNLEQRGHQVLVVERAARLRTGGSPIDVRGDAIGSWTAEVWTTTKPAFAHMWTSPRRVWGRVRTSWYPRPARPSRHATTGSSRVEVSSSWTVLIARSGCSVLHDRTH